MTAEAIVGIDLGTTNSEVAFVRNRRSSVLTLDDDGIVPSCVGVDTHGQILVGRVARNQYAAAPERTQLSIKRRMGTADRVTMGEHEYTPQEISAFILRGLKDRAERVLARRVHKAVITVPAYFTDQQRQANPGGGRDRRAGGGSDHQRADRSGARL